jgi:hypothetical protein
VRVPDDAGSRRQEIREFSATTTLDQTIHRTLPRVKGNRTAARESLMLWSLNRVLKATVRGARDSRVTLLRARWHQARPTSTKATIGQFSRSRVPGQQCTNIFVRSGWAPPGAHDHSYGRDLRGILRWRTQKLPLPGGPAACSSFIADSRVGAPRDFGRCFLERAFMATHDAVTAVSFVRAPAIRSDGLNVTGRGACGASARSLRSPRFRARRRCRRSGFETSRGRCCCSCHRRRSSACRA